MFYLNESKITSEQISQFIENNRDNIAKYKKLGDYYQNKHDILNRTVESGVNNRISNDFCGYIVDTITGYFIGKPIRYSSSNHELLVEIKEIFEQNNEQDHNAEIAKG